MYVAFRATPRGRTWTPATRLGGAAIAGVAIACGAFAGCGGSGTNVAGSTTGSGAAGTTSTTTGTTTATGTGTTSSTGAGGAGGSDGTVTGISGGLLDTLEFAIVGDTRPAMIDDLAGYPTAVATKIWQEVEATSPRPPFAISTGDYQYTNGGQAAQQIGLYLSARKSYTNVVFPTMGNHECTGYTDSNCGTGNQDGITPNYTQFMTQMLAPLGVTNPYYTVNVAAKNGSWTAKFVFVAANAWDAAQATWLDTALTPATTYTFVVRHEGSDANTAPGVTPSFTIMQKHVYTMLIAGHTHRFEYNTGTKQVIVGNGGAPLTSSTYYYGYVIVRQRASDGALLFTSYDSTTSTVAQTFAVTATGAPTN